MEFESEILFLAYSRYGSDFMFLVHKKTFALAAIAEPQM